MMRDGAICSGYRSSLSASDMAPADVIACKFLQLAFDAGLTAQLGRHGEQDIRHVIDWAIKGHDPFGN